MGFSRLWRVAPPIVAAAVLVGCHVVTPLDPSLGAGHITRDGTDTYGLTIADGILTARAADANEGGNTRIVFWPAAGDPSLDQETCATWTDVKNDVRQPGAALRTTSDHATTQAITITKNVWAGAPWIFNVHVMDSAAETPYALIGQFNLFEAFVENSSLAPPPWRMCARVVADIVSVKVWPLADPEPAWDDPTYGGSVALPAGWHHPGRPGWYVGHLRASEESHFTDRTTAQVTGTAPAVSSLGSTEVPVEATTAPRPPTDIPIAP